ncbi:MAG TPA: hypothetical protein VMF86_00980 [Stellaceae bacterium]|nr:hypothetical protein [Stellaceae bacterium]
MSAGVAERQAVLARRLVRLFRIERVGRLQRRPVATARHLIERRGAVIAALVAAEEPARSGEMTGVPALDDALRQLASEIGRCRPPAEQRFHELAAELRLRHGDMTSSGLRRSPGGRLLGSG